MTFILKTLALATLATLAPASPSVESLLTQVHANNTIERYEMPVVLDERPAPLRNRILDIVATAYTPFCSEGCTGITRTGYDVRNTVLSPSGHRVVAVDPRVIPLGSLLDVKVGTHRFTAEALDTGGAIRGHRLDLLTESERAAVDFGVRRAKVAILRKGAMK